MASASTEKGFTFCTRPRFKKSDRDLDGFNPILAQFSAWFVLSNATWAVGKFGASELLQLVFTTAFLSRAGSWIF